MTPQKIEEIARQLHEWYLEATDLDGSKYNHEAVVPYEDLPEGSKLIDRYIAEKVIQLLSQCEEEVRREMTLKNAGLYRQLFGEMNEDKVFTSREVWEILDGYAPFIDDEMKEQLKTAVIKYAIPHNEEAKREIKSQDL